MDKLLPDDIFGPPPKKTDAKKIPAPKKTVPAKPAADAKKATSAAKPAKAIKSAKPTPKKVVTEKPKAVSAKKPSVKAKHVAAKPPAKKAVEKKPAAPVKKPVEKIKAKVAKKPAELKAKPAKPVKPVISEKPDKVEKTKAVSPKKEPPKAAKPPMPAKAVKPSKPKAEAKPVAPKPPPPTAQPSEEASGDNERRRMIEEFLKSRKTAASAPAPEPEPEEEPSAEDELANELSKFGRMLENEDDEYEYTEDEDSTGSGETSGDHVDANEFRFCPVCRAHLPENASTCPHCYVPVILCPYCGRRAGGVENPKMVTEQRFNRILKQFTLFGLALPSMPLQPILDCSRCKSRVIVCESCSAALKHTAQACPVCNQPVRRTKMLINPIVIIESLTKRPDALKGIQKLIEMFMSSQSK